MNIDKDYLEKSTGEYLNKHSLMSQFVNVFIYHNAIKLELKKITVWFFYNHKMMIENNENYNNVEVKSFYQWRKFKKLWDRDRCTVGVYSKELISLNIAKEEFKKRYWPFFADMFSLMEEGLDVNNQAPISLAPLYDDNSQSINYMNQEWYNKLLNDYTEYCQSDNKSDIADKHYQEQARLHGLKFVVR